MRDFTWQMFELTGDIDAYLLYRGACDHTQGDNVTAQTETEDGMSEDDVIIPQ